MSESDTMITYKDIYRQYRYLLILLVIFFPNYRVGRVGVGRLVGIVGRWACPLTALDEWGPFGAQMAVKWPIYGYN